MSSSSNKSDKINSYHALNNKTIKIEENYNGSFIENDNKDSEKINIKTIKINRSRDNSNHKNNRLSYLKKINNSNNIIGNSNNNNYNTDNNNQNIKTGNNYNNISFKYKLKAFQDNFENVIFYIFI